MLYLLQKVDLLKYFSFREVIFHVRFLNSFDSDLLASELMDSKSDLAESPFTY
jgi:hypothetical protein